jgi:hypothetical protein
MGVLLADKMTTSSTVPSLSASVAGRMLERYDVQSREGKKEGVWGLLLLVFLLQGCGYTLQHRVKSGFANPQGLFVPLFTNMTEEIGAERVLTDAFIRELQSRGGIVITHRKAGAYEVRGTVTGISYSPTALTPLSFGGLQSYRRLPTEIQVQISVAITLVNPQTEEVLWSGSFSNFRRLPAILSRTHDYEAPSSLGLLQQSLIESQYPLIARDIMRDVYDSILELF